MTAVSSFFLFTLTAVACCSLMERCEMLLDMVGKTVVVRGGGGRRR
jgi:hypothetical protein